MKNIILAFLLFCSPAIASKVAVCETLFTGTGDSPAESMDRARLNMSFAKESVEFLTSDTRQVSTNCYITIIRARYLADVHSY
jgi:hypothetical protein